MTAACHRAAVVAVSIALACASAAVAAAQDADPRIRVSTGYHYSAGDYGTSSTTEIMYVPLSVRADLGAWRADVTVPYLRISGTQDLEGARRTATGTADGLGDIVLRGSYTFAWSRTWMPFLELEGLVKFPTASRSDGLGTGRFDFGMEAELTWVVDRLSPFATIGYRVLGSSPSRRLRNVLAASGGAQYRVLDWLSAGLLLDFRQASSASSGVRLELVPFVAFSLRPHWSVNVYGSAGLAEGSPDAGVGLEVGYTL